MSRIKGEPVSRRKAMAAVRFLVAGARSDALAQSQALSFYQQTVQRYEGACRLWWTRSWRTPLAAAMVLENAGHTGMLFFSPPDAPGVDRAALVDLVGQVCGESIAAGGMSMVQSLLPADATQQLQVLGEGGMVRLTQLNYMRLELPANLPPLLLEDQLTWRDFHHAGEYAFGQVITETYRQSLDCPALEGVRRIEDVIAGHRASGIFTPQSWWLAIFQGQPAGVLLLNDTLSGNSCDVVYLGVAPPFRGQGIGRAMLRRAMHETAQRGATAVTLAVDDANAPAARLYESEGFAVLSRRVAYVRTWRTLQSSTGLSPACG